MKIGLIALAVLAALALVAVPALAVGPQLKVTWDGSGVTDYNALSSDLYVKGTFRSTLHGEPVLVRLRTADQGDLYAGGGGEYLFTYFMPRIGGLADVTYLGTTYRDITYALEFDEYDFLNFAGEPFPVHYLQLNLWGLDDCEYNGYSWHGWYISGEIAGGGRNPDQYIDWHWFT